jgi:RNA polymerase sigma factor (TIGR02999 family)
MRCIPAQSPDVTALLLAWRSGDEAALGRLVPLVHDELRKIARRCLRGEHAAQSLQATALVNEAYLLLVDARLVNWQNRVHFLAMSARLMRRVLVDAGRPRRHRAADAESGGSQYRAAWASVLLESRATSESNCAAADFLTP